MAQPPEMSQRLIKIFVESGLDEIRRIEDQAISELMLRSSREKMAALKQGGCSPPRDSEPTGNGNEGNDGKGISSSQ